MSQSGEITLRDGRTLAYAQYGHATGIPFLYCHGYPGSRLEAKLASGSASRHGIQLIAVDRPGFGGSDFQPDRRIVDWSDDVVELMGHLEIRQFGVLAASGGAPYALACASKLPEKISCVGIVGGLGPRPPAHEPKVPSLERTVLALASWSPGATRALCKAMGFAVYRSPAIIVRLLGSSSPDGRILASGRVRRELIASMREAFRNGSRGPAHDLLLVTHDWGFRPEDVSVQVYLWHGELDRIVPASATRRQEHLLPRCTARYYPDDGHYSIVLKNIDAILAEIAGYANAHASERTALRS